MKTLQTLIAVLSITMLTSCATILSGGKDQININVQNAQNVEVFVDGKNIGNTGQPLVLKRKFKNSRQVVLKKEGFADYEFIIPQKIAPAYFLGIFALGLPCIVDMCTGASSKPKETVFDKTMIPVTK